VGGNRDQAYITEGRTDIEASDRDHIIDALDDTFVEQRDAVPPPVPLDPTAKEAATPVARRSGLLRCR
jgi:hypothetical protein